MNFSNDKVKDAAALIFNMELSYLQELQTILSNEIQKRQKDSRREAITKILNIAATHGISLEELVKSQLPKATKKTSNPIPIKYRHPEDSKLEWTGRGRQPQWIKDWNAANKSIDALLVG